VYAILIISIIIFPERQTVVRNLLGTRWSVGANRGRTENAVQLKTRYARTSFRGRTHLVGVENHSQLTILASTMLKSGCYVNTARALTIRRFENRANVPLLRFFRFAL